MSVRASIIFDEKSDVHIYEDLTDGMVKLEMSKPIELTVALMPINDWWSAFTPIRLNFIERFYNAVCKQAEENMEKPGKLEGFHSAMQTELKRLKSAQQAFAAEAEAALQSAQGNSKNKIINRPG